MNNLVFIFEGEKPEVNEFVEISNSRIVRKWEPFNGMAHVIGARIEDDGTLDDNKILVSLVGEIL